MREIRRMREERGLSRAKLAARSELNPATINRIERGAVSPTVETLGKLAAALECEVADFFPKAQADLWSSISHKDSGAEVAKRLNALAETLIEQWKPMLEQRVGKPDQQWLWSVVQSMKNYVEVVNGLIEAGFIEPGQVRHSNMGLLSIGYEVEEVLDPEYKLRFEQVLEEAGEELQKLTAASS